MTERLFNLVVPLADVQATAMRTTETNGHTSPERSGAVSLPIGKSLRLGDVDSTNHSTPPTAPMPGCRTSTTATRTTITRTTSTGRVPSADQSGPHAEFSFQKNILDLCCNGCKHLHYSAPYGQQGYPGCNPNLTKPHIRCSFFGAYIPTIVEKIAGCDGTKSPQIVRYETPNNCPTKIGRSQRSLF